VDLVNINTRDGGICFAGIFRKSSEPHASEEVIVSLRISRSSLYKLAQEGKIPSQKVRWQ